ncbi:MAG: rhomboid family intramembrane serine protease [Opitutales bacterium]|jgi:membrane associated rhomboid family serine protease
MNLLIANGMMFFFQQFFQGKISLILLKLFALWPIGTADWLLNHPYYPYARSVSQFIPWQLVTYGFLHGNFVHLFFNMLALWMFGREIELRWGSARFAFYYFFCVAGAGMMQLLVSSLSMESTGPYPTIGASGGTYGILLAFGMLFPYRRILLLFPPIPMEARFFVIFFGGLELVSGITGLNTGIAHFAHLGGMLFGFLLILFWRGKLPIKPKRRIFW